ncbi:MAG: glycine C-acetyltransferase, partial [Planctomycetota bacterium]
MSFDSYRPYFQSTLDSIRESGMWKDEREIVTPQSAAVEVSSDGGARRVLNFCANNYLGLADHPEIVAAAKEAMDRYGYGLSSVRFICGTQEIHSQLENALSEFLGAEDTILYSSCFDANAAVFETLLGPEDAVISDALNHASIIDGIRLCKASRHIAKHSDMADLDRCLEASKDARVKLYVTDGVFSMHGEIADLGAVAKRMAEHNTIFVVDDSHALGVLGSGGRGTPDECGVAPQVDLITGTLGKALGGASGGFISGRKELIALLRQRSRPYLFSNTLAPAMVGGALKALEIVTREPERVQRLRENTEYFRTSMQERGFRIGAGSHPIVPILLGDERRTVEAAKSLYEKGLFVVGFTYPVVPKGEARIRVQISAGHDRSDLDRAIDLFSEVALD